MTPTRRRYRSRTQPPVATRACLGERESTHRKGSRERSALSLCWGTTKTNPTLLLCFAFSLKPLCRFTSSAVRPSVHVCSFSKYSFAPFTGGDGLREALCDHVQKSLRGGEPRLIQVRHDVELNRHESLRRQVPRPWPRRVASIAGTWRSVRRRKSSHGRARLGAVDRRGPDEVLATAMVVPEACNTSALQSELLAHIDDCGVGKKKEEEEKKKKKKVKEETKMKTTKKMMMMMKDGGCPKRTARAPAAAAGGRGGGPGPPRPLSPSRCQGGGCGWTRC